MNFFYVYTLSCKDGFYTGCTDNLKERMRRHLKGYVPATKERRPLELISYVALKDKYIAYNFEKYLKSGSGRAFMKRHFSHKK
jgi:putative endonuclease